MSRRQSVLDHVVLSRLVAGLAAAQPRRLCYVFENGEHGVERVTAGALARDGNQISAALRSTPMPRAP
jgi:hypothetical protein